MFCLILSKLIRGNDALCLTTSLCCSLELREKKKSAAFFCVKKCVWFSCNAMQCETMHAGACIYHNQDRCSRSIDSSSVRWHLSKKSFTPRDFIYIQLFQEIVKLYTFKGRLWSWAMKWPITVPRNNINRGPPGNEQQYICPEMPLSSKIMRQSDHLALWITLLYWSTSSVKYIFCDISFAINEW